MWRYLGISLILGGTAGVLYSWTYEQKRRVKRLEEFMLFLQKSIFAMETEKIKVMDHFVRYICQSRLRGENRETALEKILEEIIKRLSANTYPNGHMVWEEVFKEEEQNWAFDQEVFQIVLQVGNGFFGRSRAENISFLQKNLKELEARLVNLKEKDVRERKVWIPVGMLGAVMTVIIFL